jgi:hypothetical protein
MIIIIIWLLDPGFKARLQAGRRRKQQRTRKSKKEPEPEVVKRTQRLTLKNSCEAYQIADHIPGSAGKGCRIGGGLKPTFLHTEVRNMEFVPLGQKNKAETKLRRKA